MSDNEYPTMQETYLRSTQFIDLPPPPKIEVPRGRWRLGLHLGSSSLSNFQIIHCIDLERGKQWILEIGIADELK
jgi:hypothetical protein